MLARRLGLEIVGSIAAESQQFVVLGTVHLVSIEAEGSRGREVVLTVAHARKTTRGKVSDVEMPYS